MIRRSRFTIVPNIVRWRRDLAKTSAWSSCPIGRGPYGCLAIPRPRSPTADRALKDAREIGQAATLMYALAHATRTYFWTGNYAAANTLVEEVVGLADEKGASAWKAFGMMHQGSLLALTGQASNAAEMMYFRHQRMAIHGINIVDAVLFIKFGESLCGTRPIRQCLALHWRSDDRGEATKARWCEAEVHRTAGEIALMSPDPGCSEGGNLFRTCARNRT